MTACHLVTDRDLSLLCDVDADDLVDSGRQLVACFTREDLDIDNDTGDTVRQTQGGIADFSCLFAEDRTQEAFFCSQFGFTLRCDLTDQDIAGMYFRTAADDTFVVQILESILDRKSTV